METDSLTSLNEVLRRHEGRVWRGVKSWKEFCECNPCLIMIMVMIVESELRGLMCVLGRRRFGVEKNWAGEGRSVVRNISSGRDDVHRIKVDEKEGFCITTHMRGECSYHFLL